MSPTQEQIVALLATHAAYQRLSERYVQTGDREARDRATALAYEFGRLLYDIAPGAVPSIIEAASERSEVLMLDGAPGMKGCPMPDTAAWDNAKHDAPFGHCAKCRRELPVTTGADGAVIVSMGHCPDCKITTMWDAIDGT